MPLLENRCWADLKTSPEACAGRPCLFLDRDGVLVEDAGYVSDPRDLVMIDGAAEAICSANAAGWTCGIVTNQSGIGRGYYSWADFEAVQKEVNRLFEAQGCRIDFVLACPFHPDAKLDALRHPSHPWRKPNPGMIDHIVSIYAVEVDNSLMVGDKVSDLLAARNGGLRKAVHVLTGQGETCAEEARSLSTGAFEVVQLRSLAGLSLT